MTLDRSRGCFVTGTDTGVGKTHISTALLHLLCRRGWIASGFKPVASGMSLVNGRFVNEDVHALREAGNVAVSDQEVGPCQFDVPCAPHIAAAVEGRAIDQHELMQAAQSMHGRSDFVVVEGVGGFVVPLGPTLDTSDVACAMGLPLILVVGLRLGCLNHALLTAEAIRARHLRLAGWVANAIDPGMAYRDENLATLQHELGRRHQAPCLGVVPWLDAPTPGRVAVHLNDAALLAALDLPENLPHLESNFS